MSVVVLFIILVVLISQMAAALDKRIQVAASVTRHTRRTTKVGLGPLSLILYPAKQSGDKGRISVGDIVGVTGDNAPSKELPGPRDGMAFNMIHLRHSGTIAATGGDDAGNEAHAMIRAFDIECENGPDIIKNVRWFAAWFIGYSMDSFVPIAHVSPGADGGAYRSEIFIPTFISNKTGVVKVIVRGESTAAHYHSGATVSFLGNVRIYVDQVPRGTAKQKKRVVYREERIDVIDANADEVFDPEVANDYLIFRAMIFTQDTAKGTMADTIELVDFLLAGEQVIRTGTTWGDLQAQFRLDFRRTAAVVGFAISDWKPVKNRPADQFTLVNDATATTATTGVLFAYEEP